MPTLLSLTADALSGRAQGVPNTWRDLVAAAAPPDAQTVLAPLFAPGRSDMPDCLTADVGVQDGTAEVALERLAALSPDLLAEQIAQQFGDAPHWRAVLDRPGVWLRRYVAVLTSSWRAYAPFWHRAQPLFGRETERIGAAAVSGSLDTVLGGISARWRFTDQTLYLPDVDPTRFELADRPVVFVPVASGSRASVFDFDRTDRVWLGYPLPGLGNLLSAAPTTTPGDRLALLLGPARAAVLRATAGSITMGELAAALNVRPSAATYHCDHLVSAGLLDRERRGREVRISRTERGDALLDLMS